MIEEIQERCKNLLQELCTRIDDRVDLAALEEIGEVQTDQEMWGISPFFISSTISSTSKPMRQHDFENYRTAKNLFKVVRAMQLSRPILLEGSPGVGKTSLIEAMATAVGRSFVRVNLSDQTDMMDLIGSNLPVSNGESGEFAWCVSYFEVLSILACFISCKRKITLMIMCLAKGAMVPC